MSDVALQDTSDVSWSALIHNISEVYVSNLLTPQFVPQGE